MSMPYTASGRVNQKERTRAAIVAAARDLVAAGLTPTVPQAAAAAGVSRTTAYRYFPNHRSLLMAAHPETAARTLLPADAPTDVSKRLDLVVQAFTSIIVATESQQRTMLRLSLETSDQHRSQLPLRQGRAIQWISEALQPLAGKFSDEQLHRLVLAIRATIGIESLAWLTDVAQLTRSEAVDLMRGSAQALLKAAVASPE